MYEDMSLYVLCRGAFLHGVNYYTYRSRFITRSGCCSVYRVFAARHPCLLKHAPPALTQSSESGAARYGFIGCRWSQLQAPVATYYCL
jgi:hypothetical protein